MNELKKLLVCALGFSVAVAVSACDVAADGACDDAGVCENAGGGEAPLGGEAPVGGDTGGGAVYNYVIVLDTSSEINADGTPGADIAEVIVTCDGNAVDATVDGASNIGDSAVCDGSNATNCVCPGEGFTDDPCGSGTNRGDNALTIDGVMSGEDDQNYSSLGEGGQLVLLYADDLSGCSVEVDEVVGGDAESYEVWVCAGASLDDCVGGAPIFTADMGGGATGDVQ